MSDNPRRGWLRSDCRNPVSRWMRNVRAGRCLISWWRDAIILTLHRCAVPCEKPHGPSDHDEEQEKLDDDAEKAAKSSYAAEKAVTRQHPE